VARVAEVPPDGGVTIAHGALKVAVFHFATRGAWYATQATCPHRKDDVLGRGLLGTQDGVPKVACPLHKKTFALTSGEGLADPRYCIRTYAVDVRGDAVWVKLPPVDVAAEDARLPTEGTACAPR
jgi:NAD(P)H-dependent nitrite reductase small subunit